MLVLALAPLLGCRPADPRAPAVDSAGDDPGPVVGDSAPVPPDGSGTVDPDPCTNGRKDATEVAIDCGGACGACADGAACTDAADCASGVCDDLVCGRKEWGVWGLGRDVSAAWPAFAPVAQGFHFRYRWADVEPAADTLDPAALLDPMLALVDQGYPVGFQVSVAAPTPDTTPAWLYDPPWSVPAVRTDRGATFPYYLDPTFQLRYLSMLDQVRAAVAGLDPARRARIRFWQSAEGSTGDEGPYKGEPLDPAYAIPDDAWTAWKRDDVWTPMAADLAADLPDTVLLINQGNDGTHYEWALQNLSPVWLKAGAFTHAYGFCGEGSYARRLDALRAAPPGDHRVRGELEGTTETPWWAAAPEANTFAVVTSALHAGVDVLNVSPNEALADPTAYVFFDRYAGLRVAAESNVGFVAFRDALDLASVTRFPEDVYGDLVAPSRRAAYDAARARILGSGRSQAEVDMALADLLRRGDGGAPFVNPARIAAIRAAFPDASYAPIEDDPASWDQDFGVDLIPGDHARFVALDDPDGASVGAWRTGPPGSPYGRFGRRFDQATGRTELRLRIDRDLLGDGDPRVRVTVTWLDAGGGFTLRASTPDGVVDVGVASGAGGGGVRADTFEVPALRPGGLPGDTDLALADATGSDTVFYVVEIERRAAP